MKIRNARPKDKFYKLADSEGLYPYVTETGGKVQGFCYSGRQQNN
jgi:hypothetical protein